MAKHTLKQWPPEALLTLLLLEFVALVTCFIVWHLEAWGLNHQSWPPVIGVFPIIVPWAGALGGVSMGLVGICSYWQLLDGEGGDQGTRAMSERAQWNAWYLCRLPVGMALGTVGAMVVVFVTAVIGTTDAGGIDVSPAGLTVLAVIAFAIGYRQSSFDRLLTRVFDILTGPGEVEMSPTIDFSLSAAELNFATTVGTPKVASIVLANKGHRLLGLPPSGALISGTDAEQFRIFRLPRKLRQDETGDIEVQYRATAQGHHEATLTVLIASIAETVDLRADAT